MFQGHKGRSFLAILFLMTAFASIAQPTLPDLDGSNEKGLVLLSWTCQYDGVKSISVLRSADSNFNYSTVGYVKRLFKGVQGYIDGHPMPGKNFYKLSIVFNSGLTWSSNHTGVMVDAESLNSQRVLPSNDVLQKMIVTETLGGADNKIKKNALAPADRDKYMEVLKKDATVVKDAPRPKLKLNNDTAAADPLSETLPGGDTRKKMTITYSNDTGEINAGEYIQENNKPAEQKKKVSIIFDDKEDISTFMESLPKSPGRRITISYNSDSADMNSGAYIEPGKKTAAPAKKISLTFKDDAAAEAYIEALPKATKNKITVSYNADSTALAATKAASVKKEPAAPKQKISIKFTDDLSSSNASTAIKSKYVTTDAISSNVVLALPDDIATHHYSIKFFDKDNRVVIEVPKLNNTKIIFDKRNFQKKGQYKFTIRKDILELESGYISIY